jgi:hypothetical protein
MTDDVAYENVLTAMQGAHSFQPGCVILRRKGGSERGERERDWERDRERQTLRNNMS